MGPPPADKSTVLFTHKFSPFAQRAHIAMLEKGIPFNPVFVDLSKKPKELMEVNPIYGKVPSLLHNGNSVVESQIILEYLEEAFPDKVALLPEDPLGKSKCRFWAYYICSGTPLLVDGLKAESGTPEREAAIKQYIKFVKVLDGAMAEFSKEGPFFCGEKFGYLDVITAPYTCWASLLERMGFHLPDDVPRLQKCYKAISEHKSVKDLLPNQDDVIQYWNSLGYTRVPPIQA